MPEQAKRRTRTCIGCGAQSDKVGLLRIVRDPEGQVSFDASGRKAGRGAYVCSLKCLDEALKAKKLQRALRTGIAQDDIDRMVGQLMEAAREEDRR